MDARMSIETYNITGYDLSREDLLFLTVTDNSSLHGDITLERSDDIGGLLLLVPTDNSVEHKNTDNNTEIDPRTKTGSEEDSNFHNWVMGQPRDAGQGSIGMQMRSGKHCD